MAKIHKYIVPNHPIRAAAVSCPEVIDQLALALRTSALAAMAGGRAAVATALLASQMKDSVIALRFRGNGPLGEIYTEANYEGHIRAHIANAQCDNLFHQGELDVTRGIGDGYLEVHASHPGLSTPQVSTVALGGLGIGDDIAHYLLQSQQVLSVVAIGMLLNEAGRVEACGGILIELMQSCSEEVIALIEANVKAARPLSELLSEGANAKTLIESYLKGLPLTALEPSAPLAYRCHCSQERVVRAFALLGAKELHEMIAEGRDRRVTCEFCQAVYELKLTEIRKIIDELGVESP